MSGETQRLRARVRLYQRVLLCLSDDETIPEDARGVMRSAVLDHNAEDEHCHCWACMTTECCVSAGHIHATERKRERFG